MARGPPLTLGGVARQALRGYCGRTTGDAPTDDRRDGEKGRPSEGVTTKATMRICITSRDLTLDQGRSRLHS